MRALILEHSEPRLVTTHPEPAAAAGEAIIAPHCVAVTATDLEVCRGLLPFAGVLGHQFVGTVESVSGPDPDRLRGRRVVGDIHVVCSDCDMCRSGLRSHCRRRAIIGLSGRDGCLADRLTLPLENLHVVPESLDDDHAVFANLLAAAMQSARQLTVEGKPYITVLGDGPLGLLTVQVMARLNASVRLVGRHHQRMALCEKWGIKHRGAEEIGRRADQDVVVECTGSPQGLALAMQLVRPRGTIVLKTLAAGSDAPGADLSPLVLNEILLIGSSRGRLGQALSALERLEVDVVNLRGRRMRLDDGPAIMRAAAEPGALPVMVEV